VIELPGAMFDEIVAHARAGMPNEACGVIAGEGGRPVRFYPMRNVESSPVIYRLDGQEQLDVMKEMEAKDWEMLGIVHSHPRSPAYPSETDRRIAVWRDVVTGEEVTAYPGTKYLILSLMEQDPVLRAFHFEDGEPVEESLRIT
jgi:proteasome lid subunit RPN8/RPN11